MHSSIWLPYLNALSLFAQKLKRSSNARAGPKKLWIRCTVSSRSRSERLRWEIVNAAPSSIHFTLTETVVMMRIAEEDYTFADGTRLPQGTTVGVNLTQTHHDLETYENQFDGFRFAKMRLRQDSRKCHLPRVLAFRIRGSCLSWTLLRRLRAQDHARAHRSQLRREDGK